MFPSEAGKCGYLHFENGEVRHERGLVSSSRTQIKLVTLKKIESRNTMIFAVPKPQSHLISLYTANSIFCLWESLSCVH